MHQGLHRKLCRPTLHETTCTRPRRCFLVQPSSGRRRWLDRWHEGNNYCSTVCLGKAQQKAVDGSLTPLQLFLQWLINNGVQDLARPELKAGLYEGENGERGVLCTSDIGEGEVIVRIPLHLALTDFPDDDVSVLLHSQGRSSDIRIASKLLRHKAMGMESPWFPYIQVLPARVPNVYGGFSSQAAAELQGALPLAQVNSALRAAELELPQLAPEAIGHCSVDDLQWALAITHSRVLGMAARGGGVGVRMLLPLVDMLNHGGDQAATGGGVCAPADNVRWDLVPPAVPGNAAGGWELAVAATRAVIAGEELLLSYTEQPNAEFVFHYGFVPPRNPHDTAPLWEGAAVLAAWALQHAPPPGLDASNCAEQLRAATQAAKDTESVPEEGDAAPLEAQAVVMGLPGGRVDAWAAAALGALGGGGTRGERYAQLALALRAAELLRGGSCLEGDLRLLASTEGASEAECDEDSGECRYYEEALQHYRTEIGKLRRSSTATIELLELAELLAPWRPSPVDDKPRGPMSRDVLLAIQLRAGHKMIYWDIILETARRVMESNAWHVQSGG